jgi:hypothetical protein
MAAMTGERLHLSPVVEYDSWDGLACCAPIRRSGRRPRG